MIEFTLFDKLVIHADNLLKTVVPLSHHGRAPSPAETVQNQASEPLTDAERKHAAGLMRINHTGEVCAQGLYNGQALTAKMPNIRAAMLEAAEEEIDHLVWCEQRIFALGSQTSVFNPLFYSASFALGAVAGAINDRLSLGFVAATEDQVCRHLDEHLTTLPEQDHQSRAVLTQMRIDEEHHANFARQSGALEFPQWLQQSMMTLSKVMTKTTYRL